MYNTGTLIRLFREKHSLKQKDLADLLGVTATYLSLIEKSKKEGSLSFYKQVAGVFKIPVWMLLWDEFELPQNPSKDDIKIKQNIDQLIPDLRSFLIKQIL